MKRLFIALLLVPVLGMGCVGAGQSPTGETVVTDNTYKNAQYGFSFAYPTSVEVHVREDSLRPSVYLGLDVDFFASVRDTVREEKPVNLAYFYDAKDLTTDAFTTALTASDASISVKSTEDVTINAIPLTKIVSTTAVGVDKTHYLFTASDGSTIIVSVFLYEEEYFQPIFDTLRKL
jgi:hypothetical protein